MARLYGTPPKNEAEPCDFASFFYVRKFCSFAVAKGDIMENILTALKQLATKVIPSGGEALLFGSQARGTAHPQSDWDVLLILNKDTLSQSDYDAVSYPFVLLGCDLGEEINPILYTQKEWQSYKATPFYENVQQDAVNLLS